MNEQQNPQEQTDTQAPDAQLTKKQRREQKRQEKLDAREHAQKTAQRKSIITWISVLVGLGLIVWGIIALSGGSEQTATGSVSEVSATDHVKGNANDPLVTIIEYSDFQCPACASYHPIVKQLETQFGTKVAIAYRHFPLKSIHPNAELAAHAAEAASLQGAFWEMHDKLFETQSTWSGLDDDEAAQTFTRFAGELGLDENQFTSDLESDAVADAVRADEQSALRAGLRGTPTFFVNSEQIPNPRGYEEFAFIVQNLIENIENNVQ